MRPHRQDAREDTDVEQLRYVSGQRREALVRMDVHTVRDLLLHVPHRYLDFSHVTDIAHADVGSDATIVATVDKVATKHPRPQLQVTEISTEDFYDRMLAAEHPPKTSQPSPHEFAEAFDTLAREGYGQVVVLTIASVLSGTYQSACLAAADAGIEVRVIDTHSASAGMGLVLRREKGT